MYVTSLYFELDEQIILHLELGNWCESLGIATELYDGTTGLAGPDINTRSQDFCFCQGHFLVPADVMDVKVIKN